MAKFKFAEWLLVWLLDSEAFEFEWDDGNQSKNAKKHGVSAAEIEEAFSSGPAVPLGVQASPPAPEERLAIVGATSADRVIVVVFTFRDEKIRPISARPANKRQQELYEDYVHQI